MGNDDRSVFMALSDNELLARLILGEARGEPTIGKVAVAHVVLNRINANRPAQFGDSLHGVILKPLQFSCFNPGDPNCAKLANLTTMIGIATVIPACRGIADLVLDGLTKDPTNGALYYHEEHVTPIWVPRLIRTIQIGRHIFYKE